MSSADRTGTETLISTDEISRVAAEPSWPLAYRLIAVFFSSAFLLVLASSAILYWATISALQSADDQVVDKRADAVIDILKAQDLNDGLLAHEINEDNQGPRQIFMRVISDEKSIALETEGMSLVLDQRLFPDPKNAPLLESIRGTVSFPDGRRYRVAAMSVPVTALKKSPVAILQVATDTTLDNDALAMFRGVLLTVIALAIPLCAFVTWVVVRRGLRPLAAITSAAQAITGANLNQRIAVHGMPAELHDLASQFNAMLSRLEATWLDLKHYADTIAHELRTPLNRMRLSCEIALNETSSPGNMRESLNASLSECERMTKLLQGLLFLARADKKQASINPVILELETFFETIEDYFEAAACEAQIDFSCRAAPNLAITGDRELLQQAIGNLIANAIAHTPPGHRVMVDAVRSRSAVQFRVADTGEGIAAEHHDRLFDRYYRASPPAASNNGNGRLGLGLSIAKSIAELHGGSIALESAPGRGTTVTITLPGACVSKQLPQAAE